MASISGLMAGFSLSIAAQVIRSKVKGPIAYTSFILFTLSSLLFLAALYIDVALSLRIAGLDQFPQDLLDRISSIRTIGTSAATSALFIFIGTIGVLGWLRSRLSGIVASVVALATFISIWLARSMIFEMAVGG